MLIDLKKLNKCRKKYFKTMEENNDEDSSQGKDNFSLQIFLFMKQTETRNYRIDRMNSYII